MNHKEYKSIATGSDTAILFIHGILGTPDHFDNLIPLLPQGLTVSNILLDGHGKYATDFSQTSMKQWEMQVEQAVCELLQSHKNLYIVAHSMGTLFAIEQAIRQERIRGLFLLAVPIQPMPKARMFSNAWKVYHGNISEKDRFGVAAKAACSIQPSKNPIHYFGWIFRYFELFYKIHKTKHLLPHLSTPTVAIQSRLDEMVSKNADRYLSQHSKMHVYTLEASYHYLYDAKDLHTLKSHFLKFIAEITGGN